MPISLTNIDTIVERQVFEDKSKYLIPANERRTRKSHIFKYHLVHTFKDIFKYSLFPRIVREWNVLPADPVASNSLGIFKS